METMKYAVVYFILTYDYTFCTSVHENQDTRSSCRSYGRCYNPNYCDGLLSPPKCSQKHLLNKLECLSALLEDKSNDSDWSDTIKDLTENVTLMVNQIGDFTKKIVEIKKMCKKTKSDLKDILISYFTENVNSLTVSYKDLKEKQDGLEIKMSELKQYREDTDKALESLRYELKHIKDNFKSFMLKSQTGHTNREEGILTSDDEENRTIDSSESKLKESCVKEIKKTRETINDLGNKLLANQEQLKEYAKHEERIETNKEDLDVIQPNTFIK
ncbi:uncharacterized protein LOC132723930, partial [Ruditapes philippinarum]|uniref:uncharacterized protein LOC132723930 n=1 Tax=Ruditapes philippinarum TaxID=129788 RepID=UPI00295BCE27